MDQNETRKKRAERATRQPPGAASTRWRQRDGDRTEFSPRSPHRPRGRCAAARDVDNGAPAISSTVHHHRTAGCDQSSISSTSTCSKAPSHPRERKKGQEASDRAFDRACRRHHHRSWTFCFLALFSPVASSGAASPSDGVGGVVSVAAVVGSGSDARRWLPPPPPPLDDGGDGAAPAFLAPTDRADSYSSRCCYARQSACDTPHLVSMPPPRDAGAAGPPRTRART